MTDAHAAIRARCAELRKLALAASRTRPGETWHVGEFLGEPAVVAASWATEDGDPLVIADVSGEGDVAALIATFGPAAVLELVVGAEEMCEIHVMRIPHPFPSYEPDTCRECLDGEWPCRTLRTTAKMIGVAIQ